MFFQIFGARFWWIMDCRIKWWSYCHSWKEYFCNFDELYTFTDVRSHQTLARKGWFDGRYQSYCHPIDFRMSHIDLKLWNHCLAWYSSIKISELVFGMLGIYLDEILSIHRLLLTYVHNFNLSGIDDDIWWVLSELSSSLIWVESLLVFSLRKFPISLIVLLLVFENFIC